MIGQRAVDFLHQSGAGNAQHASWLHEPGEVVQVQVVGPVVKEGIDGHDGVEEPGRERQRPGIGVDRKHAVLDAGIADALEVLRAAYHRSVAQTCTPNSRCRKIDDAARPQPRSSTRMPGRKSSAVVSHSVNHRELAPPLTLATIQSG